MDKEKQITISISILRLSYLLGLFYFIYSILFNELHSSIYYINENWSAIEEYKDGYLLAPLLYYFLNILSWITPLTYLMARLDKLNSRTWTIQFRHCAILLWL